MKIFALEKEVPGVSETAFTDDLLKTESARAWKLYQSGVIREMYFRTDQNAAVLVLECENEAGARAVLNTLPLVQNRLIDFEIIPLKAYPGFERLFYKP